MKAVPITKTISRTTVLQTQKVIRQLDSLCGERIDWEQTVYQTATEALYGLLGKVYAVYENHFVQRTPEERLALREELATTLTQSGVRVQKNSSVLGLLIRYVFKSDRKRVLRYQKAVEVAKSRSVTAERLADWLRENHGIDAVGELTQESKEKAATRQQLEESVAQLNAVIELRKHKPLASLSITGCSSQKISALITQPGLNGEFKIVCIVEGIETSAYNTLVRSAARKWKATNDEMSQLNAEAEKFITSATRQVLKVA